MPIEKYWPKEFYDFRVSSKWLSFEVEVMRPIVEIEGHIKTRSSDIYIKMSGLYGRSINLYELLASLFFILGKYDKLKIVLKLLGSFCPDNSEFYKKLCFLIKAQKIDEVRGYFAGAKKFELNLRKLILSFYK